jgi:phosphoserine phosphatase RsbU/P
MTGDPRDGAVVGWRIIWPSMWSGRWSWGAAAVGAAVVTVVGLVDVSSSMSFFGALAFGAFVASLAAPPRWVGLVAAYAVGWALVVGFDDRWFTGMHLARVAVVALGGVLAVAIAVARERYVDALIRTAHVAEVAQRALLRPVERSYDGAEVGCRYLSASDGALIGGDVYGIEQTPWGIRVLVADICGHGLQAVDDASALLSAFRQSAHTCASLKELAAVLDDRYTRTVSDRNTFATGILLEVRGRHVEVVNCGHPDPLLIRLGAARPVSPPHRCRPFGLSPAAPHAARLDLNPADCLLLYTDGLSEARCPGTGDFFDVERHAATIFGDHVALDAAIDELIAALTGHTDGRHHDDIVVFALRAE